MVRLWRHVLISLTLDSHLCVHQTLPLIRPTQAMKILVAVGSEPKLGRVYL
jgi:hypothetical protein